MSTLPPIPVAFINENTLGHASHLGRYAGAFQHRPELGIQPLRLDATPLPEPWRIRANRTIRGLRRFGLDFHALRWRRIVSMHVRRQLDALRAVHPVRAVIVNTQSVALSLSDLTPSLPVFVCLDATFTQLRHSRWFAPNRIAAWLAPLTLGPLLTAERRLFAAAHRLLPWSAAARTSLLQNYHVEPGRVDILPPPIDPLAWTPRSRPPLPGSQPQILFVGGDFRRKGGPLLLETWRRHLSHRCELHLLTESNLDPEPGLVVHRQLQAGSDAWLERWRAASVFVFPSTLETFGIVLLEAMAFEVPIVSRRVGAAADLLDNGTLGLLLDRPDAATLAAAVTSVLDDPAAAATRARAARRRVERDYALNAHSERLAAWLESAVAGHRGPPGRVDA
ncbi:MAG: glycosyltransferase family 4 protein [Verrucomicrobiae bacterium]|nr:glycosyltransferase family 4 protein [Verrucomicrobiae bacterium]